MNSLRIAFLAAVVATLAACGPEATIGQGGDEDVSGTDASALSSAKFETFQGKDGRYYFHLLAGNGQKVLASQSYSTLSGANGGITSVRNNSVDTSRYFLREASDGSWYFVVIAGNGKIIGVSEMYSTKSNAEKGMTTVQGLVQIAGSPTSATIGDARVDVFKGLDNKYYFHIKATNGEIVMQSQGYTTKSSANNGVSSVATNGVNAARYEVLPAADGQYFFHLKAGNGQVIAHGETYATLANAQDGVNACISLLSGTVVR